MRTTFPQRERTNVVPLLVQVVGDDSNKYARGVADSVNLFGSGLIHIIMLPIIMLHIIRRTCCAYIQAHWPEQTWHPSIYFVLVWQTETTDANPVAE